MHPWKREWLRRKLRARTAFTEFKELHGKGHCIDCGELTDIVVKVNGKVEFLCARCGHDRIAKDETNCI